VLPYAVAALGPSDALALMAVLKTSPDLGGGPVGYSSEYPYRYPAFDAVLKKAPPAARFASGATALGAALTVLAAQPQVGIPGQAEYLAIGNAGAAAYSVLNRARAAGGCAPQLDLLLLLAADGLTTSDILSREEQRTESACPHDPTPAWLAGQSQLRRVPLSFSATYLDVHAVAVLQSAIATFRRLAAEYPDDTGVLTGLGDAYLRAGTHLRSSEPFTARQDFTSAIVEYNRTSALGDARDAALGLARALVGLGEPKEAVRVLRPFATASASPGPLLEMLITADEAAHEFGAAETAARHLGQLGTPAYPDGVAVFPEPGDNPVDSLDDASLPLSFGADRLTTLSATLISAGGAGGSVQDLSFIPQYRNGPGVGTQPGCASWTWRRDAILNGHAAQALVGWPPIEFYSVRPGHGGCSLAVDQLKLIAETEAGQKLDHSTLSRDDIADARQNLLRWAGDLRAAKKVAQQWQSATGDKNAMPALRLGEIEFLLHQYNNAAAEFGLAARRWRLAAWNNDLLVDQAQLDRGAALLAAGRTAEGTQLLRPLDLLGTQGYAYQNSLPHLAGAYAALQFAALSYYACEQLADYERESGHLHAAAEDYTNALDWTQQVGQGSGVRPEVLNNNAALAYLGLGDTRTAASLESKALAADPMNPAFLMTAGFIADRAGQVAKAAHYDREALSSDPGAFPAANDLGVELTREHHGSTAVTALRQAVGASPGYALGWFNLGVLESKLNPSQVLASQGAFAMAYSLDPALKDRRHDMTIDASVYRTALDLSKPLPPRWSFSQLQRPAPAAAVGLLAVVALGFGLARASGRSGSTIAGQLLDPVSERLKSVPLLKPLSHPGWALAATAAIFLLVYLRRAAGPTEVVAYTVGVLVLAVAAMTARSVLTRSRGIAITQSSWPPALAFGLVTGAIGLPWAPLPVVRTDGEDNPRLHLAAPLTLAALSLVLFVESAWLHVPITQAWAVAALIMSASTLLPIGPLDGAHVGKAGVAAAAGVVGGALLIGLGLI
jgi:tetratricopeptide (TPR) repeat protein